MICAWADAVGVKVGVVADLLRSVAEAAEQPPDPNLELNNPGLDSETSDDQQLKLAPIGAHVV